MRTAIRILIATILVLAAGTLLAADHYYVDNAGIYTPAYASRANTFEANQTIGNYTFATGSEASPDVDAGGICLNTGTATGDVLTMKNDWVSHGITDYAETDTHLQIRKHSGSDGGAIIRGLTDTATGIQLWGVVTTTAANEAPVSTSSSKKNGVTGQAMADNENIFLIQNHGTTKVRVLGNGDTEFEGDLIVDGGEIGVTGDLDLIQLAADSLKINGTCEITNTVYLGNSGFLMAGGAYGGMQDEIDDGLHFMVGSDTYGNRNIIITDFTNKDQDHGHDTFSPDPTLFIHSVTNPVSDNAQWLSFTHDQTAGVIATGKGDLNLNPAGGNVSISGHTTWDATGILATGGEAAPDVDLGGICLDQNALDANIMTFKSSDVNHGVTTWVETDTYAEFTKLAGADGGLQITAVSDQRKAFSLWGIAAVAPGAFTVGVIELNALRKSGATVTVIADGDRMVTISNSGTSRSDFFGNGDFQTDGDHIVDGGLIGITADKDLISMASGALTINGTISATSVTASTGDVTATAGDVIAGNDLIGRFAAYDFIPVEWCHDGAVAPAPAGEVDSGNGTVMARVFGGAAGNIVQDIICPWEVPDDIVAGSGIKFKVSAVVTNAVGPANQGLSFKLSGYSTGDNDPIGAAFGAEIEVTKTALTAAQFDRLQTSYSTAVTVTALAVGELAMLHFERDTAAAADDYLKPVGVTGIVVKYEKLTAGF